jgi:hypothetical protein
VTSVTTACDWDRALIPALPHRVTTASHNVVPRWRLPDVRVSSTSRASSPCRRPQRVAFIILLNSDATALPVVEVFPTSAFGSQETVVVSGTAIQGAREALVTELRDGRHCQMVRLAEYFCPIS